MKSAITRNLGILFFTLLALSSCRNPDNEIQPTCFDEVKNQGELRVDCGGPNCPECQPDCTDGIANQDEQSPVSQTNPNVIGIDCGGANCGPCSTCDDGIRNAHWVFDPNLTEEDLASDSVGQSQSGQLYRLVMEKGIDCGFPCPDYCEPAADDGIQNGDEDGVDCGGSTGVPCPTPTCSDGIQNGTETGIDCGDMPEPSLCGECPDPTCDDGIQNIHIELNEDLPAGYVVVIETGIDCDDSPLSSCPDCPLPTCWDGIQNGNETGVDCGGSCGTPCYPIATCSNGIMDGAETGIDCDNDPSTPCPTCPTCNDSIKNGPEYDVDCVDYEIPGFDCPVCPSCHDGIMNQEPDGGLYELDIDCGSPECPSCGQEVVAEAIGTGTGSFRDQYSYNKLLAASGMTDTLNLGPNYPGLKKSKVISPFGANYMKIEANQGFMTQSDGLYVKTIILYIPWPENVTAPVDMQNLPEPTFGLCGPIPEGDPIPYILYKEKLVDNPGSLNKCFVSFVNNGENSTLTIPYLEGSPQASKYYAKGGINAGSLRRALLDGTLEMGTFTNVGFKVEYPYFP